MIMLRDELSGYKKPSFIPGDIVRHVRYHYRGVVVACDFMCMADENWYQSNNSIWSKDAHRQHDSNYMT